VLEVERHNAETTAAPLEGEACACNSQ